MKGLDSRVYYNYYDKANDSTPIGYAKGAQGSNCAAGATSATCFVIAADPAGELFGYTKNEAGLDLIYRIGPRQKLVGNYTWLKVDRDLEPAPSTTDNRFWIEYRNSMWEGLSGRLKYQYLQQRSDIDHSFTNNSSGQTPAQVPYYFSAYDIADYDQNMVKLVVDWNPMPLLDIGIGATWRKTDYKDLYYGRTDDKRQIYDASIGYGDPDKFRVSAIGNWGKTEFDQAYRNIASGAEPAAGRPADCHHVRLGHEEHPGQLAGRAAGGLGGHRKAAGHRAGQLAQHRRRGRLLVGQHYGRRRLPGGTPVRWSTT